MEAETLYLQAGKAYRNGDFDAALQACESLLALGLAPALSPAVLNLKALSLAGKGQLFAAAGCIDLALESKSDDALLQHHAARISLGLGRWRAARQAAEKACQLAPGHAGYRYHLARICLYANRMQEAEKLARQCVDADANTFEAWILLSELAAQRGDTLLAAECIKEIIRRDPGHARAWALLAETMPDDTEPGSVQLALEQIRTRNGSYESAAVAGFALADLARRAGDHARAFTLYREANERLAAAGPFAMDHWEQSLERTIAASRAWLQNSGHRQTGTVDDCGEKLVFIVGMPRSGTSLCEQIISAHPAVLGAGELTMMEHIEKALPQMDSETAAAAPDAAWLEQMRHAYLEGLPPEAASHMRITDKTPRNFERLGLVFALFPRARVLWCVRHPLDTIISCYFHDFGDGQRFSNRLDHCARMYIGQVRLMRHWMRYFGDSIDIVDYSGLVQNLAAAATEMADFLGLEFHRAMLQPHLNRRPVWTASSAQVRRPVYTSSLDNWRHYRQELSEVCSMLQQHDLLDGQGRSTVLPV